MKAYLTHTSRPARFTQLGGVSVLAFATLLIAGAFTAAQATVVYTTGFEAPGYTQTGLGGQDSWAASTSYTVQSGGLDYSGGDVGNDGGLQSAVTTSPNHSDNAIHTFSSQTGDVYFSYMLNWDWTSANSGEAGWFYLGQLNATTSSLGIIALPNPELIRGRIIESNNATNNSSTTEPFADATTVMIVGKISKSGSNGSNYDTLEFITNPTGLDEPISWTNSVTADSGVSSIDRVVLRMLEGVDGDLSGDTIAFDNITIGTEYGDVVSAIPESSSAMPFGLVFLLICLYRRQLASCSAVS